MSKWVGRASIQENYHVRKSYAEDEMGRAVRENVQEHPANEHEISLEDKDDSLEAVYGTNHGERNDGHSGFAGRYDDNEVDKLRSQLDPVLTEHGDLHIHK
jgi:hypothetical protein